MGVCGCGCSLCVGGAYRLHGGRMEREQDGTIGMRHARKMWQRMGTSMHAITSMLVYVVGGYVIVACMWGRRP